jgi:indolepyruvate ferredoxin oxidoreductase beta subunit
MTFDIVLAGVGGQGVLSLSSIIAAGAMDAGLIVKQSEVHGMAQRGGAVTAHLRLSDRRIASDLVPLGRAALVLSLEPLESLRYLQYLSPAGTVVTATQPVANVSDYPPLEELLGSIRSLPRAFLIDATAIAKRAGLAQATNMVMAGAAARWLPLPASALERCIERRFAPKGPAVVERNLTAFHAGMEEVEALWLEPR